MSLTTFSFPAPPPSARHHADAARGNTDVGRAAYRALSAALDGTSEQTTILLRAAAGAGKSYLLRQLVHDALAHPACVRVLVTAFMNRQIWSLAEDLITEDGGESVWLFSSKDRIGDVPERVLNTGRAVTQLSAIDPAARVVIATSHRLGVMGERQRHLDALGPGGDTESAYDVMFVDEAWQMPLHLFKGVKNYARTVVGVGDVGQLPPIDAAANPWRGDERYNPYRAWPAALEEESSTRSFELPAVWRPNANQLHLWRAFYREWEGDLTCVAAPGDRRIDLQGLRGDSARIWEQVATGTPTLLEVTGLEPAEAPDIDYQLLAVLEQLLEDLVREGFDVVSTDYDSDGNPKNETCLEWGDPSSGPRVVLLASRNAAVSEAEQIAERLRDAYSLAPGVLTASTVDRWQGQTNAITAAIHPLSGADELDEFNSAFGRLAVSCTRATHGLLLITRAGIDGLLADAPARPGTPFGEPGARTLPRQTHQAILESFARATLSVSESS